MKNEKKPKLLKSVGILLSLSLLCIIPAAVFAADAYPSRPIRLILNTPPGGFTDVISRLIATPLSERLGKQLVAENHGGGGGVPATEIVAKAAPDGYTLLTPTAGHTQRPAFQKLPYHAMNDFTPIARVASGNFGFVVRQGVSANSVKEFIALAKGQPGKLIFAATGAGGLGHLGAELFKLKTGTDFKVVQFKGGGPATVDLLGGHSDFQIGALAQQMPHVKSGKLKMLATTGMKRSIVLPDVPTMMEAGVTGYHFTQWLGFLAPAGTPAPIVDRLNKELKEILTFAEVRQQLLNAGAEADYLDAAGFRRFLEEELIKWADVAKVANIKME